MLILSQPMAGAIGGAGSTVTGVSQAGASLIAASLTGTLPKMPGGGASPLLPLAGVDGVSTGGSGQMGGLNITVGRTQMKLRDGKKE